jgi:hypothetical protein
MCIRCIFQVKPRYYPKQITNGTLKRGGVFAYSQAVDALRHTAKFRDWYPIQRRQNRNDTSGYAKSVYFTERGLKSGSWGIQDGLSRNNHVVYLCSDTRTRKLILQTGKTYKGINVMNATLSPVGASAYQSAEHLRFTPAYQSTLNHACREIYALYSLALVGKQAAFEGAVDGLNLGYLLETLETRLTFLHSNLEKLSNFVPKGAH